MWEYLLPLAHFGKGLTGLCLLSPNGEAAVNLCSGSGAERKHSPTEWANLVKQRKKQAYTESYNHQSYQNAYLLVILKFSDSLFFRDNDDIQLVNLEVGSTPTIKLIQYTVKTTIKRYSGNEVFVLNGPKLRQPSDNTVQHPITWIMCNIPEVPFAQTRDCCKRF